MASEKLPEKMPERVWIERLQLSPHPEGGWYRRIYTDAVAVATPGGERARVTSIHYLLTRDSPRGCLHRNRSTILHYLQHGGPVKYLLLDEAGSLRTTVLGFAPGQSLFLEVPGGVWKGSLLIDGATHALVSEVVVPGFDEADHEYLSDTRLRGEFPQYAEALADLVR